MAAMIQRRYAGWGRKVRSAERKAVKALHDNATVGEIATAVRQFADTVNTIPAPVRAMEHAMRDCEELVGVLAARGFRFASRKNAPAQLAASVYAAWLDCHAIPAADPVEWLNAVTLLVDGLAHAADHSTGTSQLTRETMAVAVARQPKRPARHHRRRAAASR